MDKTLKLHVITPVLLSFFVMSFVDLVGIGVDRVSSDLGINTALAQFIPSAAFIWFLVLSIPTGTFQAKYGKKTTLLVGQATTVVGLLLPFFSYSFISVLIGFALLGIGNTIIQVSANPLLVEVVSKSKASSFLSFSQFIKSIGSMLGPPAAALLSTHFGDWKLLFVVYAGVTILTSLWLSRIQIAEKATIQDTTIQSSFSAMGNKFIALMVLAIFLAVGIDVGYNSFSGQFLSNAYSIDPVAAESGRSIYFFGKMIGTFIGAMMLIKLDSSRFLFGSSILGIIVFGLIIIFSTPLAGWILTFIIGLAVANIFPLVFTITVQKYQDQTNEISGLMMMAISGGAIFPPIMGWITLQTNMTGGMSVLLICMVLITIIAAFVLKSKTEN